VPREAGGRRAGRRGPVRRRRWGASATRPSARACSSTADRAARRARGGRWRPPRTRTAPPRAGAGPPAGAPAEGSTHVDTAFTGTTSSFSPTASRRLTGGHRDAPTGSRASPVSGPGPRWAQPRLRSAGSFAAS
jgi:hypothetical protein